MEMPILLTWLSVVLIYVLTTVPQKEQNAQFSILTAPWGKMTVLSKSSVGMAQGARCVAVSAPALHTGKSVGVQAV